ncbi:xanthine dehydrogenase family protein molybdopterin-binding subunit [Streptomyces cavernicola]|uniref:Molybdopterin-dependent oxidoreductase n=1 Tax=Streptomyces cavernicola TaxID=3043613 RepID=A0ABT6S9H8_9ACTN|nr:molybdopterin cofactor-binding domain-containing protein [Streptomyces sp. B-S-A6]MDI3404780.1 molybdopterin-dependent oxidoreductase [Streptomyces sp. B-S-A6]
MEPEPSAESSAEPSAVAENAGVGRRKLLAYLVAAPTLTVAVRVGADAWAPEAAAATPQATAEGAAPAALPDLLPDLGDVLILAAAPTSHLLTLELDEDGTARFGLPRAEVGQGLTTAVAMLIADELDLPLDKVRVRLDDARPELLFNQLTGSSNSIRALHRPVRAAAAAARARLVATAARQWGVDAADLTTRDGAVHASDGRTLGYGALAKSAAAPRTTEAPDVTLKAAGDQQVVGRPTNRIDARAIVTGRKEYALDLDVPGAKPAMVRRPPTVNGTVAQVHNAADVRAMPGVLDVVEIPTGVAVVAETFGQALAGKEALRVDWGAGTVDELSHDDIKAELRKAAPDFLPPLLVQHIDAEYDFAPVSHAPLETNSAVADVRDDRATVWTAAQSPIAARAAVAKAIGLPASRVDFHVVQAGGSFGRRLFFDAAVEAAQVSKAAGRPVRLMWSRVDDMRHGRMRPPTHHKLRVTHTRDKPLSLQHRVASVETDTGHGIGDALTAGLTELPAGNETFAQTMFRLSMRSPYDLGATAQTLTELPLKLHTGSWRSVYSGTARAAEEMFLDEVAEKLGADPVEFRRARLKNEAQRKVLDTAAADWGRELPEGVAQGVGFHEEYKSRVAFLVELDARDPKAPRVTRAVIAVDVGRAVNPRGVEAQMLGGLTDGIATALRAGLHFDKGLPLEGSYSQFHYARQKDSPQDVTVHVVESDAEPGGVGELGVPAAVAAIGNAYARATGTRARSFPILFDVDFEPFPR